MTSIVPVVAPDDRVTVAATIAPCTHCIMLFIVEIDIRDQ